MKLLITGASGFIGSNLLHSLNYPIRAVQRKSSTNQFANIEYYFIKDFNIFSDWNDLLKDIDVVIHLVGLAHQKLNYSKSSFINHISLNFNSTIKFATSASRLGVRKFIFLSTSAVYGEYSIYPFTEKALPNPVTPYATSKLLTEKFLLELSSNSEMDVVIIRPPLVYGNGASGNFSKLLKYVELGLPLPIKNIDNLRSFISIQNLNCFIKHCINHTAASNEIFNISDGNDISTIQFVNMISKSLDKNVKYFNIPNFLLHLCFKSCGKYNMYNKFTLNFQLNVSKSKDILGWEPFSHN